MVSAFQQMIHPIRRFPTELWNHMGERVHCQTDFGGIAGIGSYIWQPTLAVAPSQRRDAGIVTVRTTGFNQDGTEVISFRRTVMVYRRGQAPHIARLKGD
jgi:hypothetical protein